MSTAPVFEGSFNLVSESEQCHSSSHSTNSREASSAQAGHSPKHGPYARSPLSQSCGAARESTQVTNLSESEQMVEGEEDSEEGLQPPSHLPPRLRSSDEAQAPLRPRNQASKCQNCLGRFRESTLKLGGRLCTNCNKIVESVQATVLRHQGSCRVVFRHPGNVEMLIRCQGGHEWSVGMQSRKAKSWCRVCRDELRVQ